VIAVSAAGIVPTRSIRALWEVFSNGECAVPMIAL